MKNFKDLAKIPSENPNPVLKVKRNKVIYINKAAENLFNVKEDAKLPELLRSSVSKAVDEGIPISLEVEFNKNFYSLIVTPIKEEGYVIIYGMDITARKNVEKELQIERDNFSNILNSMKDGIYIVDQNYDIEYTNPSIIKEFGRYEGIKCYKYFHNREDVCPFCKNPEVFKGNTVRWELYSTKNQKTYDCIDTPINNVDGSISKLKIFRDITERKKTEVEIANLAKFPSENPNPIIRATKETILYSNKAGMDLFNIKKGDRVPPLLQSNVEQAIGSIADVSVEIESNEKIYSFNIISIKTEGYTNIYGRDITERKCAEIDLQKSEATYREAYQRAEFYKDIFTHDINNILQNISNGIQLNEMYLNKPEKLNAVKRNIAIIKSQVKRGANLVSNVRKLSKISESENSLFIVKCNDVLAESVNYIKNAFNDKNIKIDVQISDTNLKILANELLEDVFENILTNSINYNDNELITINIKVFKELKQGINYIKFQFSDNGIGITDERKEQIFIRGFSEKTSVHGMGLGLSLVKKIIDSYTGEIWMEDRVKGDYTKGNSCLILIPEVVNNG